MSSKSKNCLFITAHPDDESMFFYPTISSISSLCNCYLLCLSSGNYIQSQRETRLLELQLSCKYLSLYNIPLYNNDEDLLGNVRFDDNPNIHWDIDAMISIILKVVNKYQISIIYSYDEYGISKHINHMSIYKALHRLVSTKDIISTPLSHIYCLITYSNLLSKYLYFIFGNCLNDNDNVDLLMHSIHKSKNINNLTKRSNYTYQDIFNYLLSLIDKYCYCYLNAMINAYKAMSIHESQFVWYRKLSIIFSRYTYINTYIDLLK